MERFCGRVSVIGHAFLIGYCISLAFLTVFYLREKQSISRGLFTAMLIGLSMIDLGAFSFPLIRTFDLQGLLKEGRALSYIIENKGISRSVVRGRCFIENAGLWYGFQDIQGYDPLILRRYMEYVNRSQGLPPDNKVVNLHYVKNLNTKLVRMLNLEFVVECKERSIKRVHPFIPRCWIVHRMVERKKDEVLDFLRGAAFDPLDMVVFEDTGAPLKFLPRTTSRKSDEACKITRYENDAIELTAHLTSPGFLMMSEIDYPGWKVYVDGERKEIFTGNYLFRTIPLEKGDHKIRFVFAPPSFRIGAGVSLVTLIGILLLLILCREEKRLPGRRRSDHALSIR